MRVVVAILPLLLAVARAQDHSVYVPMPDGVRLAVDVHLPAGAANAKFPALLELTRYWRSFEGLDRQFRDAGYAVVKVDVRGSGASFGVREAEYGPAEVADGHAIVDWVSTQPWCDGNVGAYGTSYSGTTADLLTACGHPALKAVCIGWSDFDLYRSPARPYGLFAEPLITTWGKLVARLDRGEPPPVAADKDGALRDAAVEGHEHNLDVASAVAAAEFCDQPLGTGTVTMAQCTPAHWRAQIEQHQVPRLVFASWLDSGTAAGALERLRAWTVPQYLVILACNHGGALHASPFAERALGPTTPDANEQFAMRLQFFDRHLRGQANASLDWPTVRWFHMGQERLLAGPQWPPADMAMRTFHPGEHGTLATQPTPAGTDDHVVDFTVGTGRANRWETQLGTPVKLATRERMDQRMLCYTSEPLAADLHVIGTPAVHLMCMTDRDDGAVLAYLEEVDPQGTSRYVTEGGLRLCHRGQGLWPTFRQADAQKVVPERWLEVSFELHPTSMCFRKGHRIRLAIAGADRSSFARVPADGDVRLRVARGDQRMRLELPVVAAPK